jgi:hypothetical protein
MRRGVIYIVTGQTYVEAAERSAKSVRDFSPSLEIDIFTDTLPAQVEIFDSIHIIPDPHRRSKVDWLNKTRFDETIFLDADTLIVSDISGLFGLLDRFDLAVAHAHSRNRAISAGKVWRYVVPEVFPQLNSGVIVFKNNEVVEQLFLDWSAAFHESGFWKDQITFRELLWASKCRFFVLPPEYNLRYKPYISFWPAKEAKPVILHHSEFNNGNIRPSFFSKIFCRLCRKVK